MCRCFWSRNGAGEDRGQQVQLLPDIEPVWCVVATPEIGVSTPQAFRDWDALAAAEGLTAEASAVKLNELSCAYASAFAGAIPWGGQGTGSSGVLSPETNFGEDRAGPAESALVRTGISSWIQNDFERVVFPSIPPLQRSSAFFWAPACRRQPSMPRCRVRFSTLRVVPDPRDAEAARERLRPAGVANHLTRTLPRAKYWREMLLQEPV